MKSFKIFIAGLLIFIGMTFGFFIIIEIVRSVRQNYTFSPLVPLIGFLAILILPIVFFSIAFKILNTKESSENTSNETDNKNAGKDIEKP